MDDVIFPENGGVDDNVAEGRPLFDKDANGGLPLDQALVENTHNITPDGHQDTPDAIETRPTGFFTENFTCSHVEAFLQSLKSLEPSRDKYMEYEYLLEWKAFRMMRKHYKDTFE